MVMWRRFSFGTVLVLISNAVHVLPVQAFPNAPGTLQQGLERCLALKGTDTQLECFSAVGQRFEDCKSKGAKADQLACFSSLAGSTPAPALSVPSKWKVHSKVEKLDGTTTVTLALDSSETVKPQYGRPEAATIIVRCLNNKTELYIDWPEFLGVSRGIEVRWRADNMPISTEAWSPSTDGKAAFAPNPVAFLKKLVDRSELLLSVAPFGKVATTLTFPIAGLEEALRPLRAACKW
jgi:type VI secretion system protein VasI